jgi:hypothetical protein
MAESRTSSTDATATIAPATIAPAAVLTATSDSKVKIKGKTSAPKPDADEKHIPEGLTPKEVAALKLTLSMISLTTHTMGKYGKPTLKTRKEELTLADICIKNLIDQYKGSIDYVGLKAKIAKNAGLVAQTIGIDIKNPGKFDMKLLTGDFQIIDPKLADSLKEIADFFDMYEFLEDPEAKKKFILDRLVSESERPGRFCLPLFTKFFPSVKKNSMYEMYIQPDLKMVFARAKPVVTDETRDSLSETPLIGDGQIKIALEIKYKYDPDTIKNEILQYVRFVLENTPHDAGAFITMQADTHPVMPVPINDEKKSDEENLKAFLIAINKPFVGMTVSTKSTGDSRAPMFGGGDTGCGIATVPCVLNGVHVHKSMFGNEYKLTLFITKVMRAVRKAIPRFYQKGKQDNGKCNTPEFIRYMEQFWKFADGNSEKPINGTSLNKIADECEALLGKMSDKENPGKNVLESIVKYYTELHQLDDPANLVGSFNKVQMCMFYYLFAKAGTLGNSGNHYLELVMSPDGYFYWVVHTGCRGLGHELMKIIEELLEELSNSSLATGEFAKFTAMVSQLLIDFAQANRIIVVSNVIQEIQGEPANFEEIFKATKLEGSMTPGHLISMLKGITHNATEFYGNRLTKQVCAINKKGSIAYVKHNGLAMIAGGASEAALILGFCDVKDGWEVILSEEYDELLASGYEVMTHDETSIGTCSHGTGRHQGAEKNYQENCNRFIDSPDKLKFIKQTIIEMIKSGCHYNFTLDLLSDYKGYKSHTVATSQVEGMETLVFQALMNFKEGTSKFNIHMGSCFQREKGIVETKHSEHYRLFVEFLDKYWLPIVTHLNTLSPEGIEDLITSGVKMGDDLELSGSDIIRFISMMDVMQASSSMTSEVCKATYLDPESALNDKLDTLCKKNINFAA